MRIDLETVALLLRDDINGLILSGMVPGIVDHMKSVSEELREKDAVHHSVRQITPPYTLSIARHEDMKDNSQVRPFVITFPLNESVYNEPVIMTTMVSCLGMLLRRYMIEEHITLIVRGDGVGFAFQYNTSAIDDVRVMPLFDVGRKAA